MGVDTTGLRFLLHARNSGVEFGRTVTIGRQSLLVTPKEIAAHFERAGTPLTKGAIARLVVTDERTRYQGGESFIEPLLAELGATSVESIDASGFEGTTFVHDMNEPIADEWHGRWDVVFDGGCLEHIFDVRTVMKNCMEMVAVGGWYLALTPMNNMSGHGFYQFSPEFFFRTLNADNGYEIQSVNAFENYHLSRWYSVTDPAVLHRRVQLTNAMPTYIGVIAQRVAEVPIFATTPQQSDYSEMWTDQANSVRVHGVESGGFRRFRRSAALWVEQLVPQPARAAARRLVNTTPSRFDQEAYHHLEHP